MNKFQVGERISHFDEIADGVVVEIKTFEQIASETSHPFEYEDFDEEARTLSWYVIDWDDGCRSNEIETTIVPIQ